MPANQVSVELQQTECSITEQGGHNGTTANASNGVSQSQAGAGMSVSVRAGQQVLEVRKLSCDVDEHGAEWWQKLASFQVQVAYQNGCRRKNAYVQKILTYYNTTQPKVCKMVTVFGVVGPLQSHPYMVTVWCVEFNFNLCRFLGAKVKSKKHNVAF